MARQVSVKSALTWFLLGAAGGAAMAWFYTPESGERNRKRLLRTVEDTSDNIADVAERLLKRGRTLVDAANDVLEKAREMAS